MTIQPVPYVLGTKISAPGIYSGVPMAIYHGPDLCVGPSASSSGLRRIFSRSPAHYWATSPYNPGRVEEADTEAKLLGRAAHHLFLGEENFASLYAVRPSTYVDSKTGDIKKWNGNSFDCQKILARYALDRKEVLTPDQAERIRGMAAGLAKEPMVLQGILNGLIEHTLVYRDEETGIWLKARPDAIPNSSGDYGDLKCTNSVLDDDLERTIGEWDYPMQGALVGEASQRVLGLEMTSFNLVFVESKQPHCAQTVSLWPADLERGVRQNRAALRMFARCMQTGEWHGPGGTRSDARFVQTKSWYQTQADRRIKEIEQELAA
jgi:hypothetical protein